jgi:hypothetical protein
VFQGGAVRTSFASLGDTLSTGKGSDDTFFTRLSTAAGAVPPAEGGAQQGVLRGVDCFDSGFAMLMGGSETTLASAAQVLGLSEHMPGGAGAVNAYGLSRQAGTSGEGLFGLGAANLLATHAMVVRHAVPENETLWGDYAASPPFVVLRLTPKRRSVFASPFPRATVITRETFDERPLAASVTAVSDRIAAYFRDGAAAAADDGDYTYTATVTPTQGQILFDGGQACIDTGWNCGGDNRDTTYIKTGNFRLPDENTVVYVVGVNHAATGNAHYSNVAVYNAARNLGIAAMDDSEYAGTAEGWATGSSAEAAAASLYVVAFARRCPSPTRAAVDSRPRFAGNGVLLNATRNAIDDFVSASSAAFASAAAAAFAAAADAAGGAPDAAPGRSIMPDGTLCVEVASEGFPSASGTQDLVVWERPYSSRSTTVGPWWNRMALPTVVQVTRAPAPADVITDLFGGVEDLIAGVAAGVEEAVGGVDLTGVVYPAETF